MASCRRADLVSSWGNDTIHCDTNCSAEDTFYVGCDDDDYENPSIRRQRLALAGQRFLDGSVPFILTSNLKGPFDKSSGWKNPWAKQQKYQNTSPIAASVDPVPPVPTKKYTRNSKGKRIAKKPEEDAECYLPSPESLKQESIAEAGHPFLDDDELDAVRSWRDNVASSPVFLDDPLASKQIKGSRHWLKTNIRKRKFDEYSPPAPKSLTSSRRHQFSDNIAANKPRAAPQLKTFTSAPAQLNAPERFYRSPTSSSTKGPQYRSQIKEYATTKKAHRPASESEDELSQDQQAATLSSPVSLKLHKTTLIKQNSSPLKNQVKLNGPRNRKKSPPILVVSPSKSTHLISAEAGKEDTVKSDENQSKGDIEEMSYLDGTSLDKIAESTPVTKDGVSTGESSEVSQGQESGDDIEFDAEAHTEQATVSSPQLPPATVQQSNAERPSTPEAVQQVDMSTETTVATGLSDTAQDGIGISDDEQDMLSDSTSDELSEVASEDIPSSVCREIAAQLRSDATAYPEENTQPVDITDNAADEAKPQASMVDSSENNMDIIENDSSCQPTNLPTLPHSTIEAEQSKIPVTEIQHDCAKADNSSLVSNNGLKIYLLTSASDQPTPEQVLDVPEEQAVLETDEDAVAAELVGVSPEQVTTRTFEGATTPEVEMKYVDDVAVTQISTPSQEKPSEFSLRSVIQRLVPSSPWARLSQVASLALAMPQDVTVGDNANESICEQEHAEAEAEADTKEAPLPVPESSVKELREASQVATAESDADNATSPESNSGDVESCVEVEEVKGLDISYYADGPTDAERCTRPAKDLVQNPTVVVDATGNEEMRTEVKAAPENETIVLQSVEVAAPVYTNPSRCVSLEKDSPASQAMSGAMASSGFAESPLTSNDSKGNPAQQPLNEEPFARSTPEPKFNFATFASFASPIHIRPAKKQLYNSKRGGKRGILRSQFNESRQRKTVTWSALLERTKDSETEVSRDLRELSPPPAAALSELPTANDDKFNKHFSAVVKRTDGLRHKFRSYSKSQRAEAVDDDEQEDSFEDIPMTSIPQVPDSAMNDHTETQEREASGEPMDIVEDLLAEMGDFLQVFDIDTELVEARKESVAQQTAA